MTRSTLRQILPLRRLKNEHASIRRLLDLIERATVRIEVGKSVPEGFQRWAVTFCHQYVDRCHHAKEENILFPILESHGIYLDDGPIGDTLSDHINGRICVSKMEEAVIAAPPDDGAFAAAANAYVLLMRQNIRRENNILFLLAQRCLTEYDVADMVEMFHSADEEIGGSECHDHYEDEIAEWEAAFAR